MNIEDLIGSDGDDIVPLRDSNATFFFESEKACERHMQSSVESTLVLRETLVFLLLIACRSFPISG